MLKEGRKRKGGCFVLAFLAIGVSFWNVSTLIFSYIFPVMSIKEPDQSVWNRFWQRKNDMDKVYPSSPSIGEKGLIRR